MQAVLIVLEDFFTAFEDDKPSLSLACLKLIAGEYEQLPFEVLLGPEPHQFLGATKVCIDCQPETCSVNPTP